MGGERRNRGRQRSGDDEYLSRCFDNFSSRRDADGWAACRKNEQDKDEQGEKMISFHSRIVPRDMSFAIFDKGCLLYIIIIVRNYNKEF